MNDPTLLIWLGFCSTFIFGWICGYDVAKERFTRRGGDQ